MKITLKPEAEHFIQKQLQNGTYVSANEIILSAIRLLAEQERPRKHLRITPATQGSGYADTALTTLP